MTVDEAGRRQAAWKAQHGDKICQHKNLIDALTVKKRKFVIISFA